MFARALPLLALLACGPKAAPIAAPDGATEAAETESAGAHVYLLAEWQGPYGGVPPLHGVKTEHFAPALEEAMARHVEEMAAITAQQPAPTFENTIEPLERSGGALNRVSTVFGIFNSAYSNPALREVQAAMAPQLSAHWSKLYQEPQLFQRVKLVKEGGGLTPAQERIVDRLLLGFQRAGAELTEAERERVAAINQELSVVTNKFSDNLLHDEESYLLVLSEQDELVGLPDNLLAAAAATATARGHEGKWAISNTRSSMDPFLTYSTRRDLRQKVWETYYARGDNGDDFDNNELIVTILKLRMERAKLLGFASHAHYQMADRMAATPENAVDLMKKVWPAATKKFDAEVAKMQALAGKEGAKITIEPWDVRFYAEKVRKAEHDLDQTELQGYLQLEKLREGMFWAVGELYGWSFEPVSDVPVPDEDVRVWKVLSSDGSLRGLWYFDPFARKGKRSGAWMNAYRVQQRLEGDIVPLVSNNSNFVKGAPGQPVLISWDDAETLFHEFGHAIHGLSSNVKYASQAGTNVARDYVEFPSQLNEHWLSTPEMLSTYALHHETGEVLPTSLLERVNAASNAASGFTTTEYLASALIDMELHMSQSADIDPDAFERDTLEALGMPTAVVMRHRTPQFAHIFAGGGYSAGYYSYLWSDTLTADVANAFEEAGSFYDKPTADKLQATILSVGDTVDPAEAFRNFRGRDPDVDALLRDRGLLD